MSARSHLRGSPPVCLAAAVLLLLSACSIDQMQLKHRLAFSPDGRFIAAAAAGTNRLYLYEADTLEMKTRLQGKEQGFSSVHYSARSLSFSPDGTQLATPGIDDSFVIWDVLAGEESFKIPELKAAISAVFSPAGEILAAAGPGPTVTLWSMSQAKVLAVLGGHSGSVTTVAFSSDGRLLASRGVDGTVRLWSVDGREQVAVLASHAYPIHSLSFSPDASLLAAYAGELKVWDLAGGQPLAPALATIDTSTVEGITVLLSMLSGATNIYRGGAPVGVLTPGAVASYQKAIGYRFPAIFSPDGALLAVMRTNYTFSGDMEISVLDARSRAMVATIQCQCFAMAFSPDGTRLATGYYGIRLWDPRTGTELEPGR